MANSAVTARLPSLDGWRPLSILLVLGGLTGLAVGAHGRQIFDRIFDGNLGVRFFSRSAAF